MIKNFFSCFAIMLSIITNAHAGCLACDDGMIGPDNEFPTIWTKVIMLSGGPGWTKAGETQQQLSTATPILLNNTYVADKKWNTLGEGEIFFALQHILTPSIMGRLGIAAAGSSPAKLRGSVFLNSNPNLRAYNYSYSIAHGRIAAKTMLLFGAQNQTFKPYIMGSLGIGFNASHQYKQTPTSLIFPVVPTFRSRTATAFAYTLGAGLEGTINQNWHAGIGYQFADWGKNNLNSIGGQPFDEGLRLSRLYTHLLQFSLTYIC